MCLESCPAFLLENLCFRVRGQNETGTTSFHSFPHKTVNTLWRVPGGCVKRKAKVDVASELSACFITLNVGVVCMETNWSPFRSSPRWCHLVSCLGDKQEGKHWNCGHRIPGWPGEGLEVVSTSLFKIWDKDFASRLPIAIRKALIFWARKQ